MWWLPRQRNRSDPSPYQLRRTPTGSIGSKWSSRAAPICRDDRRRVANLFRTQPQPRRNRDFPDHAESSLMAQSASLLTRKIFPVRSRRELPRTGLKLMSYLARLLGPERLHRRKLPVFSQLAGIWSLLSHGAALSARRRVGCLSADSPVRSVVIGRIGWHGRSEALPQRKQRGHSRGNGER